MINPRTTPRNIQFRDTVQIKEIPRDSVGSIHNIEDRSSWDPNLSTSEVFKDAPMPPLSTKMRNIVIGFIIGGVVVILIIVGIVLGVVLSQKTNTPADNSLSYNRVCTTGSNQCISSQGLTCSNGFCTCSSPYSWNSAVSSCTLLSNNQMCSSSNQCFSSSGLSCVNGLCQCNGLFQWSSINNTCVLIMNNTLTYGATCLNGTNQCNSTVELTCAAGTCACRNSKIWNISSCVCPAGTFLNSSNLCQQAFTINQTCLIGSNQCDSTKNLVCNNSRCQCDFSTRYWNLNSQSCQPRLNYSEMCVFDSDCLPTLVCPTVPGICNCPQYLPDLVCNCDNTKYFNPSTSTCVSRSSFGGVCSTSANYTCLMSLFCNGGTCACPSGTTWIAGNSTCVVSG